jgi:hypothetical protein
LNNSHIISHEGLGIERCNQRAHW